MSGVEGPVLVTGGTGALGSAVVGHLLDAGAAVAASWIVEAERDALLSQVGEAAALTLIEADLSTDKGAAAAVEATAGGAPLAGLVSLVGGFAAGGRVHEAPAGEFERMVELNLMTAFRVCRAALGGMVERGDGSIVCVGTRAALEPFPGGAGYAASKAAVLTLVKALAVEYGDDGVRANAILPSVIDTPANRASMPDADFETWVTPQAIAEVIGFLLSDASLPTSGAAIPVYGRA